MSGPRARPAPPDWPLRLALAGVLLVALCVRVWRLGDLPPGLHTDEGHYARDALDIVAGARPIYLAGNNGREPLFSYLLAAAFGTLGVSIFRLRLVVALAGVVATALAVAVVRRLAPRPSRAVVLLAAVGAGWTFWPVLQSRVALRLVLLPVWVGLLVVAWSRALADGDAAAAGPRAAGDGPAAPNGRSSWVRRAAPIGWAAVTGVVLAGAFYTHLTGRLLPLIPLASGAWWAWRVRRPAPVARAMLAVAVAAVLAAPLLRHFARHPEQASERTRQVSILNPAVNDGHLAGALADNAVALAMAPVWRGDRNRYHNLPRRPVFADPLWAVGWLAGLVVVAAAALAGGSPARKARSPAAALALVTLAVTALPSWLSADAPNFLRLTGAWPVLFAVAAVGLGALAGAVGDARPRRQAAAAFVALAAAAPLLGTARDYFGRYAADDRLPGIFNAAATDHGVALARVAAEGPTYITPLLDGQTAIAVLTAAAPPTAVDSAAGLLLPPAGSSARYAFDPLEAAAAAAFGRRWPMAAATTLRDRRGADSVTVFRFTPDAVAAALAAPAAAPLDGPATFGDAFTLVAADATVAPGDGAAPASITATLRLDVRAPTAIDHNLFVHAADAAGRTVAQFDGPPLGGHPTTDRWPAGARVVLAVPLVWTGSAGASGRAASPDPAAPDPSAARDPAASPNPAMPFDPAALRVTTGWYDWRSGARLPCPACGVDGSAARIAVVAAAPPDRSRTAR